MPERKRFFSIEAFPDVKRTVATSFFNDAFLRQQADHGQDSSFLYEEQHQAFHRLEAHSAPPPVRYAGRTPVRAS